MKERPILFSDSMVKAIIEGRKTVTRRIVKNPEYMCCLTGDCKHDAQENCDDAIAAYAEEKWPVGLRLWVRQSYYQIGFWQKVAGAKTKTGRQKWKFAVLNECVRFEPPAVFRKGRHNADPETVAWHKRLARFMPRRYSRMTLEITSVRVEKLNAISEDDAEAEGIEFRWNGVCVHWRDYGSNRATCVVGLSRIASYKTLWESIHGKGSWERNDLVWVLEFKKTMSPTSHHR